jgi:5-methylcytosine-specific restriction endonuclease McrA
MSHKIDITKEIIEQLYIEENISAKEIANRYRCSNTTILNWIRKFGFKDKIRIGYPKGRKNLKLSGNLSPTKRLEVQQKMRDNHYDCSGDKNPNYGATWMIGEGNPNWLGGISDNGYYWKFNEELKESIRNRDSNKCKECGLNKEDHYLKYNENLHVHHIDYNKDNCNEDNLITLCLKCNISANYNREQWETKFKGAKYGK